MKNSLLIIGLSILLFFCWANYCNAQTIFEFRKAFSESLPENYALVKLAPDVDIYVVTDFSGCHIDILARKLGIFPIMQDREYSGHAVAFPENSPGLNQLANKLDDNNDGIIVLAELLDIYPEWE